MTPPIAQLEERKFADNSDISMSIVRFLVGGLFPQLSFHLFYDEKLPKSNQAVYELLFLR